MRKLLVLGGLAAAAAVVAKRLTTREHDLWHTPDTDADTGPERPYAPAAPADDSAGASPDEALADAAEAPHAVTDPDHPLAEEPVDDPDQK